MECRRVLEEDPSDILRRSPSYDYIMEIGAAGVSGIVEAMKRHRDNPTYQICFCNILYALASDGDWKKLVLENPGNILDEVSINILLALRIHFEDKGVRQCGCHALCALLETPCQEYLFKFGAAKMLVSILNRDFDEEITVGMILETINTSLSKDKMDCDELIDAGCMEAVLKALRKNLGHQIPLSHGMDGMATLGVLLKYGQPSMDQVQDASLVVTEIMKQNDSSGYLLRVGCHVLGGVMCQYPEITEAVKEAGVLALMLSIMKNSQRQFSLYGCGCLFLRHFVGSDEDMRNECFAAVVSDMKAHAGDYEAHEHNGKGCASVFFARMAQSDTGAAFLAKSEVVPVLLDWMKEYPLFGDLQTNICYILHCLLLQRETRDSVSTDEIAFLVARAMNKHAVFDCGARIRLYCLKAAESLLLHGDKNAMADAMLKEGSIKVGPMAMRYEQQDGANYEGLVCSILYELASFNRDDIKVDIASCGGIEVILKAMKGHPALERKQEQCCKTLGMLTTCKDASILESITKADGVNILMDAVEGFRKNKVIFNFGGSAALLTREFELKKKRALKLTPKL